MLGFPCGFFDHVLVVVSSVTMKFCLRDFDNRPDQLVEEFAIVGNHQDGAWVVSKVLLKPDKRFEVEMVGGFVQQEEIGFLNEEAGEVCTHDPTATEGFGFTVKIGVAEGETAKNLFGPGFELPSAQFRESIEGFVVLGVFESAGGFMSFDRLLDAGHFWGSSAGQFENCFIASGGRLLGEKPKGDIFFESDAAFVWRCLA